MGQGFGLLPAGRGEGDDALGIREAVTAFDQALVALQHLPENQDTLNRPSISGLACGCPGTGWRIRTGLRLAARRGTPC